MGRDYVLGHGDRNKVNNPKRVVALESVKIVDVACGRNFIIALDETGAVYGWGNNMSGQCGSS
jgi:alpha-tubulin suppressor-like RCC1 family protein